MLNLIFLGLNSLFDFVLLIRNVDELFLALKKCNVIFRLLIENGYCVRAAVCSHNVYKNCTNLLN